MKPIFATLTVAVDGSEAANRSIDFALDLAAGGGAIGFCSVVDDTALSVTGAEGAMVDLGPMMADLETDAERFCRDACCRATAAGLAAHGKVLHGACASEIVGFAAHGRSEAIVMGTRGRRGLEQALFGSVAEAVVRSSGVPAIVVHADDETRTGPVVVALDDSACAGAAFDVALQIASARGRSLALVNVLEPEAPDARDAPYLDEAFTAAGKRGVRASIVLVSGRPVEQLIATTDRLEACLVVMGTHGRPFFPRMVLGSVANGVVRRARIPVVTVRQPIAANRAAALRVAR